MFSFKKTTEKPVPETLVDRLKNFLSLKEFRYEEIPERNMIKTGIRGKNLSWHIYLRADEERNLISISSVLPLYADDVQKLKIADLLNRINYRTLLGTWCLDNEDGEISYTIFHLTDGNNITDSQLDIIFDTCCRSVDNFFPAIASVNYGNAEPVIAFNSIF